MNFVSLQKALAQNKVYDAWQYVQSLAETLGYMNMSAELLERVYAHRLSVIKETEQSLLQTAIETGQASITEETLKETHLDIAGLKLDDSIFFEKDIVGVLSLCTIEYGHFVPNYKCISAG